MSGILIESADGEVLLDMGMVMRDSFAQRFSEIEVKEGERILGVKSANKFNSGGLHHFDLQFFIGRIE